MSKYITEELVRAKARIVAAPDAPKVRHQIDHDRSFEMPTALYATMVGLFLAFIAIMFVGFNAPGMVIPTAIFVVFIAGMFGVPAIWTRLKADNPSQPLTMSRFARDGIMTHTGRLSSGEATAQMLILPVLVLLWGLAVVTIAALV